MTRGITRLLAASMMAVSSLTWSGTAYADGDTTGKITKLRVYLNLQQIYIEMNVPKGGVNPSCATSTVYVGAVTTGHFNGSEIYASLLSAWATGATIQVIGEGTCRISSTVEDVKVIRFSAP